MQACKKVNLTVSYADYPNNAYGNFDHMAKRFTGEYANSFLDHYFLRRRHETQEEVLKYCTFRRFAEEGRLLPNGTWTGAIGDVVSGSSESSDVTLRFQNQFIKPGIVDFSNVVGSEDVVVGHYIDEKRETLPLINFEAIWSILVPSVGFLLEYLSMFALSLAFVYLLGRFLKKEGIFVLRFATNLFTLVEPAFLRCSAAGLFFNCSLLFLFLVQQILSNSVKTDKVIVSDEPILDTLDKLRQSNKEICYPLQEDIDIFLNSDLSRRAPSYKMVREMIIKQKRPCCLSEYQKTMNEIVGKNFFILHGKPFMNFLKMLNPLVRKDIFIGDRPFESPLIVYYLSFSINKRAKAEFNRQVSIYLEGGYKIKAFNFFDQIVDYKFPRVRNIFHSGTEYMKHYTLISDVTMNDFSFVYLFFIKWSLTLLIFALHCNIGHIRSLLHIGNRHLKRLMGSIRRVINKAKIRIIPGNLTEIFSTVCKTRS